MYDGVASSGDSWENRCELLFSYMNLLIHNGDQIQMFVVNSPQSQNQRDVV